MKMSKCLGLIAIVAIAFSTLALGSGLARGSTLMLSKTEKTTQVAHIEDHIFLTLPATAITGLGVNQVAVSPAQYDYRYLDKVINLNYTTTVTLKDTKNKNRVLAGVLNTPDKIGWRSCNI